MKCITKCGTLETHTILLFGVSANRAKNDIFFATSISRGGLLRRVKAALKADTKSAFDVLYVVDSRRSWYTERNKVGKSWQHVVKHYEQHVQMS